ncbi:MAG: Phosphocholine transferase AnkX [Wolbachia endosymbiont of Ctenocephalides orientis wCori]|nr:MAG: Phosphocholine transferase AnkX [Wolbachia endosymbiont of Ctenocephalides orientis wCori]
MAAQYGRFGIVKLLTEKGADFKSPGKDGKTPLHLAANNDLYAVQYLISKGAEINVTTKDGTTPLYLAAQSGRLDIIEYLINNGADVNNQSNNPLGLTDQYNGLYVINYIIDRNANFKRNWSTLHSTVIGGKLAELRNLVGKGEINVNQDENGCPPLHLAVQKNGQDIRHDVNTYSDGIIEYLIELGADLEDANKDGWTALHLAVQEKGTVLVSYLIEKGANVNAVKKDGWASLHIAARYCDLDMVEYLEEKGANIGITDNEGATPLHGAAYSGKLDVVKYLIDEKNADFKATDKQGITTVLLATYGNHLKVVKYLIGKGENVNVANKKGETPLHWAVYVHRENSYASIEGGSEQNDSGYSSIAKYLMEGKSANLNIADNQGETPFHWAAKYGRLDLVEYLASKVDSIDLPNKSNRWTSLHYAANTGKLVRFSRILSK